MGRTHRCLIAAVTLSLCTGCATAGRPSASVPSSPTVSALTAAVMLDPSQAAVLTSDALRSDPDATEQIVASAVTAAPGQSAAIVLAAKQSAPDRSALIDATTKRALRSRPAATMGRIPDHADLERLIDRSLIATPR